MASALGTAGGAAAVDCAAHLARAHRSALRRQMGGLVTEMRRVAADVEIALADAERTDLGDLVAPGRTIERSLLLTCATRPAVGGARVNTLEAVNP